MDHVTAYAVLTAVIILLARFTYNLHNENKTLKADKQELEQQLDSNFENYQNQIRRMQRGHQLNERRLRANHEREIASLKQQLDLQDSPTARSS